MKKKVELLKKEFRYLSLSRKLVFFAALATAIFLFIPWGTRGEQKETYEFVSTNFSAFGIFPVFGYILTIVTCISFGLLVRELTKKQTKYKGITHSTIWAVLGGLGAYTIMVALFILNSPYLKGFDSQFSLKIGIFLALFMQGLLILGGMLGKKDDQKTYLKESLSRPHEIDTNRVHLEPEPLEDTDQMSLGDYDK